MEEKRTMVELLGTSKKKSIKETVKRMHDIDRNGGSLDKAIAVYWLRVNHDYQERFQLWREIVLKILRIRDEARGRQDGGESNEGYLKALVKGYYEELKRRRDTKWKEAIFDNIMKGTSLVDEEETVTKSHERRAERRKREIEEIAAQKAKKTSLKKASSSSAKY